jgi:hypothetical protein
MEEKRLRQKTRRCRGGIAEQLSKAHFSPEDTEASKSSAARKGVEERKRARREKKRKEKRKNPRGAVLSIP